MEVVSARRMLSDRIETCIATFEAKERQPDRWQCDWLIQAMVALESSDFPQGEIAVQRAEVTGVLRSLEEVANIPTTYELLSTIEHRAEFERIKAEQPR